MFNRGGMQHQILVRRIGNAPVKAPFEQGKRVAEGIRFKWGYALKKELCLWTKPPPQARSAAHCYREVGNLTVVHDRQTGIAVPKWVRERIQVTRHSCKKRSTGKAYSIGERAIQTYIREITNVHVVPPYRAEAPFAGAKSGYCREEPPALTDHHQKMS